jgi:putative peptidoglycan lipid II flippase
LTVASGVAAWIELWLLRGALERRIGEARLGLGVLARLALAALLAAAAGLALKALLPDGTHPVLVGAAVLLPYGALYFALAAAFGSPDARALMRRVRGSGESNSL